MAREPHQHPDVVSRHNGATPAWPVAGSPFAGPVPDTHPGGAEKRESLWATIDDRLRGRWRWTILLAAVLGTGLGIAGWRSAVPMFESVGVIRVTPTVPVTLERIPEVEVNRFSMFANTQVQLIRSRRVLENAMDDPEVRALSWSQQPDALSALEDDLEVYTGGDSELIYVAFEAADPKVAQTVVNGVIRSYHEIYGMAGGTLVGETLQKLRVVESQFMRQLNQTRTEISRIEHRYGTTDLIELQETTRPRIDRLRQLIAAAEATLAQGASSPLDMIPDETRGALAGTNPLILERLEQIDPKLGELRQQRSEAKTLFDTVKQRYREDTAAYRRARRAYETVDQLYQDEYLAALELWERMPEAAMPLELDASSFASLSVEQLQDKIDAMKAREAELSAMLKDSANDQVLLADHRMAEERLQGDLERTRRRIQGLELEEQNIAGRIVVEQEGYRPTGPSSDKRRKRAAMAAAFGCAVSFGLFFLWGTVDRRAFGARQLRHTAETGALPVLGVLPHLGSGGLDSEASDMASHCVHQIRNQIEAVREPRRGYVMAVSSPFQGDGKTSIALALGWSYSVAGYRTLLLDCDLVGRSLSRQLGMLDQPGLKEAITSGGTSGLVRTLRDGSLQALPVGTDPRFGPEAVRRIDLDLVFNELRDSYDLIIVDTGPLLGSLESTPVTSAADGVVLSVRRGRARSRLEECSQRLASVRAHGLGVILNCAARSDCHRYVSEQSLAAYEEDRVGRNGAETRPVLYDERNVLMIAMEMTSREHQNEEG